VRFRRLLAAGAHPYLHEGTRQPATHQLRMPTAKAAPFTVAGADATKDIAPAPVRTAGRAGNKTIHIDKLDVTKLEVGQEIKTGNNGDKYIELKYDGSNFCVDFAEPPDYVRSPFKAGPPINRDKQQLGTAWSISIEFTQDRADKWTAIENHLIEQCKKLPRDQIFPPKSSRTPSVTDAEFEGKFNSILKPADLVNGYPHGFRLAVQHEAIDSGTGQSRTMPTIFTCKRKQDDKGEFCITKPKRGDVNNLVAKSAIACVGQLSRGIYFNPTGWGMKFRLAQAYVYTNMTETSGPQINLSNVKVIEDDSEDEEPPKRLRTNEPFAGDDDLVQFPDDAFPSA